MGDAKYQIFVGYSKRDKRLCKELLANLQLVRVQHECFTDQKLPRLLEPTREGCYVVFLDNVEDLLDADGRFRTEHSGLERFLHHVNTGPYGVRGAGTSPTELWRPDPRTRAETAPPPTSTRDPPACGCSSLLGRSCGSQTTGCAPATSISEWGCTRTPGKFAAPRDGRGRKNRPHAAWQPPGEQ